MRFAHLPATLLCCLFLLACPDLPNSASGHIAAYRGTYRGIGPLADGTGGYGEQVLVIDNSEITVRLATRAGETIRHVPLRKLAPMSKGEIAAMLAAQHLNYDGVAITALRPKDPNEHTERLLFMTRPDDPDKPTLIALDTLAIVDSGVYWSQKQVEDGAFTRYLEVMEGADELQRLSD